MSLTIHDLRVSLREKMKVIEELERRSADLKHDLDRKNMVIRENEANLKKKDEIISMRELTIKEKDIYILKLETELLNLKLNMNKIKDSYKSSSSSTAQVSSAASGKPPISTSSHNGVSTSSSSSSSSTSSDTNKKQANSINNNNSSLSSTQTRAASPSSKKNLSPSSSSSSKPNDAAKKTNASSESTSVAVINASPNYYESIKQDKTLPFTNFLKSKRIAISAEPAQIKYNKNKELQTIFTEYPKSEETQELLKNAIAENDFMKNLEIDQINNIVNCMYPVEFAKDSLIIKEGDVGNIVYATEEGRVEVLKTGKSVCTMGPGRIFGELAILYNCTRTASIRALSDCKLWAIDRNTFQTIMMRFGIEKHEEYMELLKNIPIFQGVREDILTKFIDTIDECNYNNNEFIIRQFAKGDTFYVISKGRVRVTKSASKSKWEVPKFVKYLSRGEYFGENALVDEETREFNVIADDPNGVSCLVLDRQSYSQLLNDPELSNFKREESFKKYKRAQTQLLNVNDEEELDLVGIRLSEFEILSTLGVGGFGRVELVRNTRDLRTYALKIMKKQYIIETKQQDHVINERTIMFESRSNFICRLYKTFKDKKYLYLLLEVCLGGELWSILRDRGNFEENETKFYTACVLEALSYLHGKGIVYRDLKPENLLLNAQGYCKLVDFGFAKKVGLGKKTWTFCGTPEYVAPEIILNKGHDIGADYWSLGILIFELLSGNPPFSGSDPMATYNVILKGIEAVDFPRKIPKIAGTLIKRLCRENAVDRIGYQRGGIKDIQKHKWFEGFSWENLRSGTLEAPYVPKVVDNTDVRNFDAYPDDTGPTPEDDLSGWDFAF